MKQMHALWNSENWNKEHGLYIWAEGNSSNVSLKKQASTAQNDILQHPFSLSALEIKDSLSLLLSKKELSKTAPEKIFLQLPSVHNKPFASTSRSKAKKHAFPKWWETEALYLPEKIAFTFLSLNLKSVPSIKWGASIAYWQDLLNFSLRLSANQSFLPSIEWSNKQNKGCYRAVWNYFMLYHEQQQLDTFLKEVPKTCLFFQLNSYSCRKKMKACSYETQYIITHFIHCALDNNIREILEQHKKRLDLKDAKIGNPVVKKWLTKLTHKKNNISGKYDAIKRVETKLSMWQTNAENNISGTGSPLQTCLRIVPPEKNGLWSLEIYLSPLNDPYTAIPMQTALEQDSHDNLFISVMYEDPKAKIFHDLNQLLPFFPDLKDALNNNEPPTAFYMDQDEITTFLDTSAQKIENLGIKVELPKWWHNSTKKMHFKLHIKQPPSTGQGLLNTNALVSYDWKVAIGNTTVSTTEFKKMVDTNQKMIQINGEWVALDQKQIQKMLQFLQEEKEGEQDKIIPIGEAFKMGYNKTLTHGAEPDGIESDQWAEQFLEKLNKPDKIERIATPKNFKGTLRPYQEAGLSWLTFLEKCQLGACLADDMGLGKTIQIIAWLLHQKENCKDRKPTLLICPMSVVTNWENELKRFGPSLKTVIHHGNQRLKKDAFLKKINKVDIVITTYALAYKDINTLAHINWQNIILDEAQSIKNSEAKQTKAIKSLSGKNKVALTGTPIENRLTELWSIIDFTNPGYLGTVGYFTKHFSSPIETQNNKEIQKKLKQLISPCILRRTKEDKSVIQDLPEKVEHTVVCTLSKEQASLYQGVVNSMLTNIDDSEGINRSGKIFKMLTQLKQICNHPAQFLNSTKPSLNQSGKITRLIELLEVIIAENDKVLIFTQFKTMGDILTNQLKTYFNQEVLFLHGGSTKNARTQMINQFSQKNGPQIFILSLKAGGVGLNLIQANHVFHFDRWWNPAVENQATDRAFRIGQKRMVQVHKFVCKGTLEEQIDKIIEKKKDLASEIIGSSQQWITQLSDKDLKNLVALKAPK